MAAAACVAILHIVAACSQPSAAAHCRPAAAVPSPPQPPRTVLPGPAPVCCAGLADGGLAHVLLPHGRKDGAGQGSFAPAHGLLRARAELRCLGLRGAGGLPRKGAGDYYDDMDEEDEVDDDDFDRPPAAQRTRPAASILSPNAGLVSTGAGTALLSPAARLFLADQQEDRDSVEEGEDEDEDEEPGDRAGDGPGDVAAVAHVMDAGAALESHFQHDHDRAPNAGCEDMDAGIRDGRASSQQADSLDQSCEHQHLGDDALVRQLEDELETVVGTIGGSAVAASASEAEDILGSRLQGAAPSVREATPPNPHAAHASPLPSTETMGPRTIAETPIPLGADDEEEQAQGLEGGACQAAALHEVPGTGQSSQARGTPALDAPRVKAQPPMRPSTHSLALKIQR